MTRINKILMLNQVPDVEITFEYLGKKTRRLFVLSIKEKDKLLAFDKYGNTQAYAGLLVDDLFAKYCKDFQKRTEEEK